MFVAINNATTDIDFFDEYVCIANGEELTGQRCWVAAKAIDDEWIHQVIENTEQASGTFFINYEMGKIYLSYLGFEHADALAVYSIEDWTNCHEVFISLLGWAGNQIIGGDGSYFDNFQLTYNYDSKCIEPLVGDLTGDCRIDFSDLAELARPCSSVIF